MKNRSSVFSAVFEELENFVTQVNSNSAQFLRYIQFLQQSQSQISDADVTSLFSFSLANAFDFQIFAQVLTDVIQRNSVSIASTLIVFLVALSKFEKLSDIKKYERNRDQLNAWEQSFIHRMHANHDRYSIDIVKIVYVESRLIIEKKTHNLMNQYRKNDICTLMNVKKYLKKLRYCCENSHEQKDVVVYLYDTLKQSDKIFTEYFHLFCQKKDQFRMTFEFLIICLKRNVNYQTQFVVFFWRILEKRKFFIFYEYVQTYSEFDEKLQVLKHRQSRFSNISVSFSKSKASITSSHSRSIAIAASVVSVTLVVFVTADDFMNLSVVMIVVQNKILSISEIRDICNKWKLCYYCKQQHLSKIVKECSNKKLFTFRVVELEDDISIDENVSLSAKKV